MKALRDWALKEGLGEYDLSVGRKTCSIFNETRGQEK